MILGHRYQCDQCGRVDAWDDSWRRYSSIRHDETCPELMPTLCSKACQEAFMRRVERGEVRLPKLHNHGSYSSIREGGQGYGVFAPEEEEAP